MSDFNWKGIDYVKVKKERVSSCHGCSFITEHTACKNASKVNEGYDVGELCRETIFKQKTKDIKIMNDPKEFTYEGITYVQTPEIDVFNGCRGCAFGTNGEACKAASKSNGGPGCHGVIFKQKTTFGLTPFRNPEYNKIADECGLYIDGNNLKVTYREIEFFVDQVLKSKGVN